MLSNQHVIQGSDADAPTTPALRRRLAEAGRLPQATPRQTLGTGQRCRLCGCNIDSDPDADRTIPACGSCKARPEARRLRNPQPARSFTEAERFLIRKISRLPPAASARCHSERPVAGGPRARCPTIHRRAAARRDRSDAGSQTRQRSRLGRTAKTPRTGQTRRHARSDHRAAHQRLRRRLLALPETLNAVEGHPSSPRGGLNHEAQRHPPG